MELFELGQGRGADVFSSPEAFEKIRDGLNGYDNDVVLVVKPEVSWSRCGGEGIEDHYVDVRSLGLLKGSPQIGEGIIDPVVFPMEKYVFGVGHYEFGVKDGNLEFHCCRLQNVEVFTGHTSYRDSGSLVTIYAGQRAIESQFSKIDAVQYFRAMNTLGAKPTDDFMGTYWDEIRKGKRSVLKNIEGLIREDVGSSMVDNRKKVNEVALGWDLDCCDLKLSSGVIANIGDYLSEAE